MKWNIAERLGACQKEKGWTNMELARRAGINPTLLWKILNGDRPHVAATTVRRLARALGVSTDYLLSMDVPDAEMYATDEALVPA